MGLLNVGEKFSYLTVLADVRIRKEDTQRGTGKPGPRPVLEPNRSFIPLPPWRILALPLHRPRPSSLEMTSCWHLKSTNACSTCSHRTQCTTTCVTVCEHLPRFSPPNYTLHALSQASINLFGLIHFLQGWAPLDDAPESRSGPAVEPTDLVSPLTPSFASVCSNANALAEAMGMGVDLDMYAKLLSNFFNLWDRNLILINWCIQAEFKTSPAAQSGSLMRGNTFLSKLESEFARMYLDEGRKGWLIPDS
jgi:hypothetical protein